MTAISWLAEVLGAELYIGKQSSSTEAHRVVIFDAEDLSEIEAGDVLLIVGSDLARLLPTLPEARRRGAVGIIRRAVAGAQRPLDETAQPLAQLADDEGLCVLTVGPGAGWTTLVSLARTALAQGTPQRSTGQPAAEASQILDVTEQCAATLGAAVFVLDANNRLLAHSASVAHADADTQQTVLGRTIPPGTMREYRNSGLIAKMLRGGGAVTISEQRRVVLPIQDSGVLIGTLWVAHSDEVDEAKVAAVTGLAPAIRDALRATLTQRHAQRRLATDQLATLLHGDVPIDDLPRWLTNAPSLWVFAISAMGTARSSTVQLRAKLYRRLDLLNSSSNARDFLAGELNNVIYVVLGTARPDRDRAQAWLDQLTATTDLDESSTLAVGVGGPVSGREQLAQARRDADRALTVGRAVRARTPVWFADAWARWALQRLANSNTMSELLNLGPLPDLIDYDRLHSTSYVETLRALIQHGSDSRAAAEALNVHANTLRYRRQRLEELLGGQLGDRDVQTVLYLQLELLSRNESLGSGQNKQ
ncbi:PucR family transcriptional regulator [Mycolicibacterium sp. CBM1]